MPSSPSEAKAKVSKPVSSSKEFGSRLINAPSSKVAIASWASLNSGWLVSVFISAGATGTTGDVGLVGSALVFSAVGGS